MIQAATFCVYALALLSHRPTVPQALTCIDVHVAAERAGIDPVLLTAMSWHESRFTASAVSSQGARGPLQVMPQYFCPNKTHRGCDLIKAGVRAFKEWQSRHPVVKRTLCHYNQGNTCRAGGQRYARKVLHTANRLRQR